MPAPYSLDLRQKVIACLENGQKRKDVASMLHIGTATIQRWWSLHKQSGNVKPKQGYQKGHSHKITDINEFRSFVEKNRSLTSTEMALKIGDISASAVCRYLKKINFTRKKTQTYTRNGTRSGVKSS